jgi:hypothetical protein
VLSLQPGLLHTIIFNRSLGPVKPQDVDSELFDITYVSSSSTCLQPLTGSKFRRMYTSGHTYRACLCVCLW